MTRQYLSFVNGKWKEVNYISDFWIDRFLYEKLLNIKKITSKKWDAVIVIDGKERSGKSGLGMTCAWFLADKKVSEHNFARGLEDASNKIASLPDGSVLIVDEGSLVFSAKDSMSKQQKKLVKILDVVGQKNMTFIICLPCFFDLNKTIAVRRSLFLLHVYPDKKYNRGNYAFFGENRKKKLYVYGKKNFDSYEHPKAETVGSFFDFQPPFYKNYLEKVKKESLQEVLGDAIKSCDVESMLDEQMNKYIYKMRTKLNLSFYKIADVVGLARQTVTVRFKNYEKHLKKQELIIKPINITNPIRELAISSDAGEYLYNPIGIKDNMLLASSENKQN